LEPNEAIIEKLRLATNATAATDDPAFTWRPAYSNVAGALAAGDLPTLNVRKGAAEMAFVRFQMEVTAAGKVKLLLNSTEGLQAWLDGAPLELAPETICDVATGIRTVTIAIDTRKRRQPLRVELGDLPDSPAQVQLVGGK